MGRLVRMRTGHSVNFRSGKVLEVLCTASQFKMRKLSPSKRRPGQYGVRPWPFILVLVLSAQGNFSSPSVLIVRESIRKEA